MREIEPKTTGWEAQTLPLCNAVPPFESYSTCRIGHLFYSLDMTNDIKKTGVGPNHEDLSIHIKRVSCATFFTACYVPAKMGIVKTR